jgi:hypothetical protein
MYPPKVSDEAVLGLIRELTELGRLPSGAVVRSALARRFRSRGGVTRIYRLLARERVRLDSKSPSNISTRLLEQENRNLREQLTAARQRDDAHQAHWNREVGQLRARVDALESAVLSASPAGEVSEALRQQVQQAEVRAGQLEVQIRTFGPAANRGKTGG